MARSYALADVAAPPHPAIQLAAREAILGKRRGWRALLPFLGPAFIASIAYLDPGNLATNIAGAAQFRYGRLWVLLMRNLLAIPIQRLAAEVGIVTATILA